MDMEESQRLLIFIEYSLWRHQMETFSVLLALGAGKSPVTSEFPAQRPVTWSFDVFFYLRLNKRLSKQSWGRWFETPLRPLWRHCNVSKNNLSGLFCASIKNTSESFAPVTIEYNLLHNNKVVNCLCNHKMKRSFYYSYIQKKHGGY